MKTIQLGIAAAGLAALLAGCASKGGARNEPQASTAATADTSGTPAGTAAAPQHRHGTMGMSDTMCPMAVQGTTAREEEVDGGAALIFTTSSGDVQDLRKRVRSMAEMHNAHFQQGGNGTYSGTSRGMGMGPHAGMRMPPSTASAEDVDGGARLVLKATDPSQVDVLRQHAKMHAEHIAAGECPMMMEPRGESQDKSNGR